MPCITMLTILLIKMSGSLCQMLFKIKICLQHLLNHLKNLQNKWDKINLNKSISMVQKYYSVFIFLLSIPEFSHIGKSYFFFLTWKIGTTFFPHLSCGTPPILQIFSKSTNLQYFRWNSSGSLFIYTVYRPPNSDPGSLKLKS